MTALAELADKQDTSPEPAPSIGEQSKGPPRPVRGIVHPRETKLDKLQRHVVEASKQCGRNVLLQVQPLMEWKAYCVSPALPVLRLLAHPGATMDLRDMARGDVVFAVGPEG